MLIKKMCPECWEFSYSANTIGRWICPICGFDLTRFHASLLDTYDLELGAEDLKRIIQILL